MNQVQPTKNEKELQQITVQFKQNLQKIVDFFSTKLKAFVQKMQSQFYNSQFKDEKSLEMAQNQLKNTEILGLYILKDGQISLNPFNFELKISDIPDIQVPVSNAPDANFIKLLKEKMDLLKESARVNQEKFKSQIRLLELAKEELESVCKKIIAQRDTLMTQLEKLSPRVFSLDRAVKALESANFALKQEKDTFLHENAQLSEENFALKEEIAHLKHQLQELTTQLDDTEDTISNKTFHAQSLTLYHPSKEVDNEIPYQSICIRSLFELKQKGWKVRSQLREKIQYFQAESFPVLSILGNTGSGKSWFASQLGSKKLAFGWQHNPHSISSSYVPHEGRWFSILDASGWNEQINAGQNDIVSLISASMELSVNNQQEFNGQTSIYNILKDDSKLIEDLKLFYMLKSAGIVVFVSSKLDQSDLDKLYSVNKFLKGMINQTENESMPEVVVVHNFSWLGLIADVEAQVKTTLEGVFHLEELSFSDYGDEMKNNGNINKTLFKDQFGSIHLIIAAENTEAGDYYNPGAIRYLLSKINQIESQKEWSFCESFADFCNSELKKLLYHDFSLQFIADDGFISAADKTSKVFTPTPYYSDSVYVNH